MDDLVAFLTARLDEDEVMAERHPVTSDLDWRKLLREVAAKRAILIEHEPQQARPGDGAWHGLDDRLRCRVCASATENRCLRLIAPCWTLMQLAAVYSDHPDYRDEWKP